MENKKKHLNAAVIIGPTSVGKTKVASEILKTYDGELINSDKFYLFQKVRIGSGLSDTLGLITSKKYLFEILNPSDNILTTSQFTESAEQCVKEILNREKFPLIEGGSVKYNLALSNLNEIPNRTFYYKPIIGLRWSASCNPKKNIRSRVEKMFLDGLIEETSNLIDEGLYSSFCLTNSVVYSPVVKYLKNELEIEQTKELIVNNIQDLAIRQLQRFEKLKDVTWIEHDENSMEQTLNDIHFVIRQQK